MIQVEIVRQVEAAWWDALVRSVQGDFEQSTWYAAYYTQGTYRTQPHYVIASENGTPLGLALFVCEGYGQRAFTAQLPAYLYAAPVRLLHQFGKIATLVYGPLIFDLSREPEILARLLQELDRFAAAENIFWWKQVLPPIHQPFSQPVWDACFAEAGFARTTWGTLLVDLTVAEEALWQNLKHSARKAIKKVEQAGVIFKAVTDETLLHKYHTLLVETRQRANLSSFGDFEALRQDWQACPEFRRFFLVEHEGQALAGQGVILFNHAMREIMAGTSDYALAQKLYGGDVLKFELLKWGKQRGFTSYDLAGVHPQPATQAEQNIRQFKEKWGGRYLEYPIYSKVYGRKRHALLNRLKQFAAKSAPPKNVDKSDGSK